MILGVLQGRLSEPNEGFQEYPNNWKREFDLLPKLGLNHIEWIITYDNFHSNPIFHRDISEYPISSVCADFMVSNQFCDSEYLNKFLRPLCEAIQDNDIKYITIPLLEESDITNDVARKSFINEISNYGLAYPQLTFSFEIESYEHVIQEVLEVCPNFRLTYDTGNMTSLGINHKYYIQKFIDKIDNVHLKDRTFDKKTVLPTHGATDFNSIFENLSYYDYSGRYTIQTAREKDGDEVQTIKRHKKLIENLYE